jgi:hypothetical protein
MTDQTLVVVVVWLRDTCPHVQGRVASAVAASKLVASGLVCCMVHAGGAQALVLWELRWWLPLLLVERQCTKPAAAAAAAAQRSSHCTGSIGTGAAASIDALLTGGVLMDVSCPALAAGVPCSMHAARQARKHGAYETTVQVRSMRALHACPACSRRK